jgi:hypothetical protein
MSCITCLLPMVGAKALCVPGLGDEINIYYMFLSFLLYLTIFNYCDFTTVLLLF